MSEIEKKPDIVDTTDYLETATVFQSAKNFLFLILLIGLIILQLSVWMNYLGYVQKTDCGCGLSTSSSCSTGCSTGACTQTVKPQSNACLSSGIVMCAAPVEEAAEEVVQESQVPVDTDVAAEAAAELLQTEEGTEMAADTTVEEATEAVTEISEKTPAETCTTCPSKGRTGPMWSLDKFDKYLPNMCIMMYIIRITNYIVLLAAILYCLTMLMAVKISLAGRLGGLNHISRAFFRSLYALVLLVPWQVCFKGVLVGGLYTHKELLCSPAPWINAPICSLSLYWLRFGILWLIIFFLIVSAQCRSRKWSKAVLRRLGIMQ